MQINDLARGLRDAFRRAIAIDATECVKAIDEYDAEFDKVERRFVALLKKRAGTMLLEPGDSPEQRLNSPRLTTTYPAVRKDALWKVILDNEKRIAQLAGPMTAAMIARDFAKAELEMEEERSERVRVSKSDHRKNGIYKDVAAVADRLHAEYGVSYHHWKCVDARQVQALAEVLWNWPDRTRHDVDGGGSPTKSQECVR